MGSGHPHPHGGGHGHSHGHAHAHASSRASDRRRLLGALALTAIILVAEVAGGFYSHSLALLSDAGHMLSDAAAQALSLVALAIAARPADARRTYGYHRIEILAALANGVALILLSVWIFYAGYTRLVAGAPAIDLPVMMVIAAIGLVANLGGAWLLHDAQSLNLRGAYLHVLTDTLSSVAVLLGGGVMMLAHGGLWLIDPILSMAIAVFITYSAVRLVRETVDVLLEAVPVDVDLHGVIAAMMAVPGVSAVHDLHIWTITSGMRALSAHLVVDDAQRGETDRLLSELKELFEHRFTITHSTIQIESRGYDDQDGPGCASCPPLPSSLPPH